jgi:rare lipoprotein A
VANRSLSERVKLVVSLVPLLFLYACASNYTRDSAPDSGSGALSGGLPDDAIPRQEPKSRYGNGPYYEVFGETYKVLDSSYNYQERGVASWYGKKFHGRKTSSQEDYDMYAMTAAHKSLPLPTYVRVRNLSNNKSVVVRVNDRGPFVDNRLIDLSYSAALKLDMVQSGTSLVEVTAISYDQPTRQKPAPTRTAARKEASQGDIFVQVGAFGEAANARRRIDLVRSNGLGPAIVHQDTSVSPQLYRVRIGPIADVLEYDSIVAKLQRLGITETHLVTE